MRRGFGAADPHRARRAPVQLEPVPKPRRPAVPAAEQRASVARFFIDLRRVLRVTPHQAAVEIVTRVETIEALESGQVNLLPQWPETARVVMAYAGLAGIDGRPVLTAIASLIRDERVIDHQAHLARPAARHMAHAIHVERLRQARHVIARNAIKLPREAIRQVRQRPDRAFYAVSFPMALVLVMLNTSLIQSAFAHLPRPVRHVAESAKTYFQVQFAPVRDGLRWIDVDDPRKRRGDKLPVDHR